MEDDWPRLGRALLESARTTGVTYAPRHGCERCLDSFASAQNSARERVIENRSQYHSSSSVSIHPTP